MKSEKNNNRHTVLMKLLYDGYIYGIPKRVRDER